MLKCSYASLFGNRFDKNLLRPAEAGRSGIKNLECGLCVHVDDSLVELLFS